LENWNPPLESDVAVRESPLTGFEITTVAPGITAPVESVTVPLTLPDVLCPTTTPAPNNIMQLSATTPKRRFKKTLCIIETPVC
jgi:hypothetical protein